MYAPSVCAHTYCLRSARRAGVSIDLFNRVFAPVADRELEAVCQKPTGGQAAPPGGVRGRVEVSFVVTYKDSPGRTVQCMAELLRTSREAASAEFVLVNDGSVNATAEVDAAARVLERDFGVRVARVRNAASVGYGEANNMGVRAASGRYVVLMNNDAFVTRGWLRALLATARAERRPGLVGPLFVNSSGWVMEAGGVVWADGSAGNYGRFYQPEPYHLYRRGVDYISAACVLVERDTFLEVGGFAREYGRGYWEDTDLAFALAARGRSIVYQPLAVVVHDEGGSLSAEKEVLMRRNQATFIARWRAKLAREHCPPSVPLAGAAMRLTGAYRLLWVDDVVPEVDRDSGSVRTMHMLRILLALGFHVDYQATASAAREERYEAEARAAGVNVLPRRSDPAEFDLRKAGAPKPCMYDVILVARSYVYERVAHILHTVCHGVPVIFDTVDVAFLREARVAMSGEERWQFHGLAGITSWLHTVAAKHAEDPGSLTESEAGVLASMRRDLALMAYPAATLVVSGVEARLLRSLAPAARVAVVSNVHDVAPGGGAPEGCAGRRGVLFVGNLNHVPNQQAILALVDEVLPATLPLLGPGEREDFVLHIVGSNSAAEADLSRPGLSVHFHGWLPDPELRALYRSVRAVVAPLMSGAGVKGKVNQAMLQGVPVVATPVAAEGMWLEDGASALIASNATEFAAKVVAVLRDCALWERLVRGGRANVERYFSVAAATTALAQVMTQLGFAVPVPRHTYACNNQV